MKEKNWITVTDVCEIYPISRPTLYNLIKEGKIYASKINKSANDGKGGKWIISKESIESYFTGKLSAS